MQHAAQLISVAKPLYALGDLVNFRLEGDDEFIFGLAYIIGIYKEPHHLEGEWNYMTHIVFPNNLYCDHMVENEITSRVLHGA